jgi:hypothetical protein
MVELRHKGALVERFVDPAAAQAYLDARAQRVDANGVPWGHDPGFTIEPDKRYHVLHGGNLVDSSDDLAAAHASVAERTQKARVATARRLRHLPPALRDKLGPRVQVVDQTTGEVVEPVATG